MITDKFIAPAEMGEIKDMCERLTWMHNLLVKHENVSIDLFTDEEGYGRTFNVSDSNGESLGHIGFSPDGETFVLYLDDGKEDDETTQSSV